MYNQHCTFAMKLLLLLQVPTSQIVMVQLVSLNFLILGGQFQIQKISIVLVTILVEQLFKMTTNLDFYAKWLHGLKDGTIAKYQIVTNYSQLKHPHSYKGPEAATQRCTYERCSENMLQIYRKTPMPKCDFNKAAKQLY